MVLISQELIRIVINEMTVILMKTFVSLLIKSQRGSRVIDSGVLILLVKCYLHLLIRPETGDAMGPLIQLHVLGGMEVSRPL